MTAFSINSKKTLSNSSIVKVLQNPYNPSQLISAYFSGLIHLWKLPNLAEPKRISLPLAKITSLIPFQNSKYQGFLLGVRNGQLMLVDQSFSLISSSKIHNQCISEIIIKKDQIITISYDGKVLFIEKDQFKIIRELQLEYPLFSGLQFNNQLYVSSVKSFLIDLETYKYTENKGFNKFFLVNDRVYGCSDQRGLTCMDSNSNNYIPVDFILIYQRIFLIFSEKSICVARKIQKLEYKVKKYNLLSLGEQITTGFSYGDNIYVGGNQGNIYWITETNQLQEN